MFCPIQILRLGINCSLRPWYNFCVLFAIDTSLIVNLLMCVLLKLYTQQSLGVTFQNPLITWKPHVHLVTTGNSKIILYQSVNIHMVTFLYHVRDRVNVSHCFLVFIYRTLANNISFLRDVFCSGIYFYDYFILIFSHIFNQD